jgi:hypothetical protein
MDRAGVGDDADRIVGMGIARHLGFGMNRAGHPQRAKSSRQAKHPHPSLPHFFRSARSIAC